MIIKCTCKHEEQDKLHGPQCRVANPTKDPDKVRCTVCKREHNPKSPGVVVKS